MVPGEDVQDSHVLCLAPDKTKTSKGEQKDKSEPSKAAKKQGKDD